jgi:hypothetical protein
MHGILPGREAPKAAVLPVLSVLDATDQYTLEMYNIISIQEAPKVAAAPILSVLDATDRYALEMHNILHSREAPNRYGLEMYHIKGDTDIAKVKTNEKIFHIQQIRDATRAYKWSQSAVDAGFIQLYDCISHTQDPAIGAMGVHFIHPERFDDQLVLEEPEVLVYEQKANGRMKLAAVEYIIPEAAWNEDAPPVFLGQELKYKTTMGKYGAADGIDPYYEIHVWAWKHNPSGFFSDWNPKVSCSASSY